ncbi:MAG: class I SAM-dependent methyltransferase [Pseudomonadota bacterium]
MSRTETGDAADHMDGIYRYQRHIYDATRKYFLLGRDRLLNNLQPPEGGSILEVGCGTARNLVLAAKRYPNARLYGFDISDEMLITARASIERAGLADRITLAQADATAFDVGETFGIAPVDRAFCSYTLSMIPPWRAVLPAAMDALAPGGQLHIVDFGQQSRLPGAFRAGLFAWLKQFSVHPRADLEVALREAIAGRDASLTFETLYRGYADYAVIERRPESDFVSSN